MHYKFVIKCGMGQLYIINIVKFTVLWSWPIHGRLGTDMAIMLKTNNVYINLNNRDIYATRHICVNNLLKSV